jgi:hypothetical protein
VVPVIVSAAFRRRGMDIGHVELLVSGSYCQIGARVVLRRKRQERAALISATLRRVNGSYRGR